ncbi:MAG: M28 family peptidase [bacterium]|nr:M28 family peptidase [bacterium]
MKNKGVIFDIEYAWGALQKICEASEYIEPILDIRVLSDDEVGRYLHRGRLRMDVALKLFQRSGYFVHLQHFDYRMGFKGANALMSKTSGHSPEFLIVAHHDYCAGVGAEDNASGLAVLVALAEALRETSHPVAFASFDLEEIGLFGSKHFVNCFGSDVSKRFPVVIALDCIGSGKDVVVCKKVWGAESDSELIDNFQKAASRQLGETFTVGSFDYFNSDHVPFAQRGSRTMHITSCDYEAALAGGDAFTEDDCRSDGSVAHTKFDIPERIRIENLKKVGEALCAFIEETKLEHFA